MVEQVHSEAITPEHTNWCSKEHVSTVKVIHRSRSLMMNTSTTCPTTPVLPLMFRRCIQESWPLLNELLNVAVIKRISIFHIIDSSHVHSQIRIIKFQQAPHSSY